MTPASWMTLTALLLAPAAGFWIGWRLGRAGPAGGAPHSARDGATAAGAARHAPGHEWIAYAQGRADVEILADSRPGGPEDTRPAAPAATGRTYLRARP